MRPLPPSCVLALTFASACVAYEPVDADLERLAAASRRGDGGTFSFASAAAVAMRDNPELRAAAARARAVGVDTVPFDVEAEWRGNEDMLALLVDPLELLGVGPRAGAVAEVAAEASAAAVELAQVRWRVFGELLELFLRQREVATLTVPALDFDAAAWERSGVAAPAEVGKLRAAQARAVAMKAWLDALQRQDRAALARVLGRHPDVAVAFDLALDPLRDPVPADDAALLRRPDLRLTAARLQIAEATFRRAVAEQYPAVKLGPDLPLDGGGVQGMAVLRLPFHAVGRAEAARERRDAAFADLSAAWLAVSQEAVAATAELEVAAAEERAAEAARDAAEQALRSAAAAARTEIDGFGMFGERAVMALAETEQHHRAVLARVRAQARFAFVHGWPLGARGLPEVRP
ncbi:MAG: TolC family protein [Planctomycetes bacterium]|nr:TolC family protein [Planctomycetota bacterium]